MPKCFTPSFLLPVFFSLIAEVIGNSFFLYLTSVTAGGISSLPPLARAGGAVEFAQKEAGRRDNALAVDARLSPQQLLRTLLDEGVGVAQDFHRREHAVFVQALQDRAAEAALDAAVPGGYILYSTCSICSLENESVIEKLKKKRPLMFRECDMLEIMPELKTLSEACEHGRIVLPDVQDGSGPLYFCLLQKGEQI